MACKKQISNNFYTALTIVVFCACVSVKPLSSEKITTLALFGTFEGSYTATSTWQPLNLFGKNAW